MFSIRTPYVGFDKQRSDRQKGNVSVMYGNPHSLMEGAETSLWPHLCTDHWSGWDPTLAHQNKTEVQLAFWRPYIPIWMGMAWHANSAQQFYWPFLILSEMIGALKSKFLYVCFDTSLFPPSGNEGSFFERELTLHPLGVATGECLQHARCLKCESKHDNDLDFDRRQPMMSPLVQPWV